MKEIMRKGYWVRNLWRGKPNRHARSVINLSIEVATRKDDSIEALSDALAGDALTALLDVYKIPAARVRSVLLYSPEEVAAIERGQE